MSLWRQLARIRASLVPLRDPHYPADRWMNLVDEIERVFDSVDLALEDCNDAPPHELATFTFRRTALRVRVEQALAGRVNLVTLRAATKAMHGGRDVYFAPSAVPAPVPPLSPVTVPPTAPKVVPPTVPPTVPNQAAGTGAEAK